MERAGGRAAARRVAGAARRRPSRAWRRASHTAVIRVPALRTTTGSIVIRSTPSGAGVTVNGRWRGRTPLTIDALQFGSHAVRVVQPGFTVARENVRLSADQPTRTLAIRMQPNPAPSTPAGSARTPFRAAALGSVPIAPSTGRPESGRSAPQHPPTTVELAVLADEQLPGGEEVVTGPRQEPRVVRLQP